MPQMNEAANTFHICVDETSKSSAYFGVGAIFFRRDAAKDIAAFISAASPIGSPWNFYEPSGKRPYRKFNWSLIRVRLPYTGHHSRARMAFAP